MTRLLSIVKLILKRTFNKPSNILLHIVLPVVASVGLFMVMGLNSGMPLSLALVDDDQSVTSRNFLGVLEATSGLRVQVTNEEDLEEGVMGGWYAYGIKIPKGFEAGLSQEAHVTVGLYGPEGSKSQTWLDILVHQELGYYKALRGKYDKDEAYSQALETMAVSQDQLRTYRHADDSIAKDALIQTLGTYLLLMMISTFTIAFKILEEKEAGTFTRIGLSSAHPRIYIYGNILAGLGLAMVQIGLVLISLAIIGVNFYASLLATYLVLCIFAMCAVSISVLVAVVAQSSQEANASIGFIIAPSCMVAGCMWPLRFMPDVLQKLAYLMPQRWTLDALMALQDKADFLDILPALTVVMTFSILFALLATYKVKSEDRPYAS